MANLVIVADMVRGFMEEGYALGNPKLRRIAPFIGKLLDCELARGSHVIFVNDNHDPDDLEFKMFPRHCVRGTPETEVIRELARYATEIIPKTRYSAFFGTTLEKRIKELKPEKIIVLGVYTDICVLHTVADARARDYVVEVPAAGVDTPDPEMHEFALQHMEKVLGAKVIR